MKQAFVTGGSGFLGRNLLRRLGREGIGVNALVRSAASASVVENLGANAIRGDLDDVAAMSAGMAGCDVVFHAAAHVEEWDPPAVYERINVTGTDNAMLAAEQAGVGAFVHVGTEAIFADGHSSMARLDEQTPIPARPLARYPATKAEAERRVRARNGPGMRTVVVRPRFIWGRDDTSVMPKIVAAVRSGRFMWLSGGRYLTSTTHVDNVCEGLMRAALAGRGGEAYFVTDGDPVEFRSFLTALLQTQGVDPGDKSFPLPLAQVLARICELAWAVLPLSGPPPIHRVALCLAGSQVVCDDGRARREIGYREVIGREEGLATLQRVPV